MSWSVSDEQIAAKVRGHAEDVPFFVIENESFNAGGGIALVHVKSSDEGRRNAEFIVRACNAHDDLVKEGERLQFVIDNGMPMCNGGRFAHLSAPGTWFDTAREAIDAALAKAGAA